MDAPYLIYGANGYTGELIARAAKARGSSPILAGRSTAVTTLAGELGLKARTFSLDDPAAVDAGLTGIAVVLNCAGPFKRTARALADGCLRNTVHYLDITGDVNVLEALAGRAAEARNASIMLLPGVGFDVVPTDCLAMHLKRRLPTAIRLALAFQGVERASRGSAIGTVERLGRPGLVRRSGQLTPVPLAKHTRTIDFGTGPKTAVSIPWGDLCTAYHSTAIPSIEVFMAVSARTRLALRSTRAFAPLLQSNPVQTFLKARVARGQPGPSAEERARGRTRFWGEAVDGAGQRVVSRLEAPEVYSLTVLTALAAIDKVMGGAARAGFHTPATLFGPDFVLEIAGVERRDECG